MKKKKIPGAKYKVRVNTLNASTVSDTPVCPLPSRITARLHDKARVIRARRGFDQLLTSRIGDACIERERVTLADVFA